MNATEKVPSQEVLDATRQMAVLARLGFNLGDGLQAMAADGHRWLGRVAADVTQGDTLTQAVSRHPRIFSPFYRAMVEAAEAAEQPEQTLSGLSHWLERADRVQRRSRNSLFYPLLVLNAAMLELLLIVTVVLPVMIPVLHLHGYPLPDGLVAVLQGPALPGVCLTFLMVLDVLAVRPDVTASLLARLPAVWRLQHMAQQGLWAQAVGTLLGTGMPLPAALEKAASVVTDPRLARTLRCLPDRMYRGDSLSDALLAQEHLTPTLAWSVAAGERGEDMAPMLLDAAVYIDREVDLQTEHTLKMMEPWVQATVGIVVLSVLMTFWAPFYNMVGSIG